VFSLTKFYTGIFYRLKLQNKMMLLDYFRQSVLSFYLKAYINYGHWRREKSLAPARELNPGCAAHSPSLYQLSYPTSSILD
jgi:hypothetical protein